GVPVAKYLGLLARIRAAAGKLNEAHWLIQEALSQLHMPAAYDVYNSIAEVFTLTGEIDLSKKYALEAYKFSWADGEPYCWWWGVKRAIKTLIVLKIPIPHLPVYEGKNVASIPHEIEIRDFIKEQKRRI